MSFNAENSRFFEAENTHESFMKRALELAEKAKLLNEVPIGCVIVYNGKVIGEGYNCRNSRKNSLAHAEILAINEAAKFMNDWRLENCTIYITLEPCPMCAGAIVQARIKTAVFGAKNPKAGSGGSIVNILQNDSFNHQVEIIEGVCAEESAHMLKEFFKNLRNSAGD